MTNFKEYAASVQPKRDAIKFIRPGRCGGFWLDKESKGCGHVVRLHYLSGPLKSLRSGRRALAKDATCPICGERYPFAFYKMKGDEDYKPTEDEENDIRLLWADLKLIAKGGDAKYDLGLAERVRIHCRQTVGCEGEGHGEID